MSTRHQINTEAVQTHLELIQSVIQRMATNSASCKAWAVALVSAILVIIADKGKPQYTTIAIIPSALFLILDSYYLTLEKMFINSYNLFVKKLHEGELSTSDLYVISPSGDLWWMGLISIFSFSIWPFYLALFGIILITQKITI